MGPWGKTQPQHLAYQPRDTAPRTVTPQGGVRTLHLLPTSLSTSQDRQKQRRRAPFGLFFLRDSDFESFFALNFAFVASPSGLGPSPDAHPLLLRSRKRGCPGGGGVPTSCWPAGPGLPSPGRHSGSVFCFPALAESRNALFDGPLPLIGPPAAFSFRSLGSRFDEAQGLTANGWQVSPCVCLHLTSIN